MDRNGFVLVTGSSGLIGSAVSRRLAARHAVVGLDRPGEPHPPEETEAVDCDLTSDDDVRRALEHVREAHGPRLLSVVHLAAYYDFAGEPSPLYEQVTVRGTERLLHGLHAFACEQFLFSSTMLVHAPCEPGERIGEEWPLDPRWDYPRSKVVTEELIRRDRRGIRAVMLRIAGVYDDLCHSIPLAHQIDRIQRRTLTSRVFPGNTSHGQAFVHLEDVVDCIERAVERRAALPAEAPILIGEPVTLSYDELQHSFARLIHGESWETLQIPKTVAKVGAWIQGALPADAFIKPWMIDLADDHYALDVTRAQELLGWEPRRSLAATLPRMIEALKRDASAWFETNGLEVPEEARNPG